MVKIRLRRVGAKKQPSYRVVVADSRSPRDGRFIETIGHYNPRTNPPTVVINEERALYWLSVGAQATEPVARFFNQLGLADKLQQVHAGAEIGAVAAPVEAKAPAKGKAKAKATPAAAAVAAEVIAPVTEEVPAAPLTEAAAEPVAEAVAAVETVAADDLAALGLSSRVAHALEAAGIHTVSELAAKAAEGDDALTAIAGIGAKAADEIREKLAAAKGG
jgi:small subunit ribosomal protein S16